MEEIRQRITVKDELAPMELGAITPNNRLESNFDTEDKMVEKALENETKQMADTGSARELIVKERFGTLFE